MLPLRLYIENFMCHNKSFIDFTQFSSALIVGKLENNDLFSNGVGKSTIFKAIEYCLFNQADVNLEKIIRDDAASCQIVMDFSADNTEYRVSRKRTKKGSTDVSLYVRNAVIGDDQEIYHSVNKDTDDYVPLFTEKFWKDISCRRAADTEKELEKILKINFKGFRSTVHFMQNDFSGLPTATPEKRKSILKEVLNLAIYSKLEKLAKDKSNSLLKDIEKTKILIDNLGDPESEIKILNDKFIETEELLTTKNIELSSINQSIESQRILINSLNSELNDLETKFASLAKNKENIILAKSKIEESIKEYNDKTNNIVKTAKLLITELKSIKESISTLEATDFSIKNNLEKELADEMSNVTTYNVHIQNNILKLEELNLPMPKDAVCKHCRQDLTQEHRVQCLSQIDNEKQNCQNNIKKYKQLLADSNVTIKKLQLLINDLNNKKSLLEDFNSKLILKNQEIQDKKALHEEYVSNLNKFKSELNSKIDELDLINKELDNSPMLQAEIIKNKINEENSNLEKLLSNSQKNNKEIIHLQATKAVIEDNLNKKNIDKNKLNELNNKLLSLNSEYKYYPNILQAFSSTGIPNLIIQNVLDDLQIESNNLLNQLKPGLQLSFIVEKTVEKTGDQADTLDINYFLFGKERSYEQLSGAQKLAVSFSLKLGLSFLLQKMFGTDIKLLLLDEIDQSLDKAGVDAFADIVKFFQKDFNILVITHNDRLKDKFSQIISVEQDANMISKAKVLSSW